MRKEILSAFRGQAATHATILDELFLEKRKLFLLLLFSLSGLVASVGFCLWPGQVSDRQVVPLLFSGVPVPESGFFTCFSTILLNSFLFLTAAFLLGLTAFGSYMVPVLLLFKGVFMGVAVSSALWVDGLSGLGKYAILYTPSATAALFLLLLFGKQSMDFSKQLRKNGLSSDRGGISFRCYGAEYIGALCVSVLISFFGAVSAALCAVFFVS